MQSKILTTKQKPLSVEPDFSKLNVLNCLIDSDVDMLGGCDILTADLLEGHINSSEEALRLVLEGALSSTQPADGVTIWIIFLKKSSYMV